MIFVKIFQALGASYNKDMILRNAVFVTVKGINASAHVLKDDRVKYKFRKNFVYKVMLLLLFERKFNFKFFVKDVLVYMMNVKHNNFFKIVNFFIINFVNLYRIEKKFYTKNDDKDFKKIDKLIQEMKEIYSEKKKDEA